MPRSITIHPLSLALGLVTAGVAFLTMSQGVQPVGQRIEYGPHPRDMVQLHEGTTYVVPPGRVFVLAALGSMPSLDGYWCGAEITANGQPLYKAVSMFSSVSMVEVPEGVVVPAGASLVVTANVAGPARAWGYLADVPPPGSPPYFRVHYGAHPSAALSIEEGQQYMVPAGQVLVVTGLWSRTLQADLGTPVQLLCNGTAECVARRSSGGQPWITQDAGSVPTGLTFHPGDVVEVVGGNPGANDGVIMGYLASL